MDPIWNRTKHAFEKMREEGEKAAEKMVGSFEELGDTAKARLEKSRSERALHKRIAELGSAVYEIHRSARQEDPEGASPAPAILEDPKIRELLDQVASLDEEVQKAESQLKRR